MMSETVAESNQCEGKMSFPMQILLWILKSKGAKIGMAGAAGGSGVVALILNLHTDITSKIEATKIEVKQYVDNRHDLVQQDIHYIKESQGDIKEILKVIDKRLYDLKIGNNKQED